MTLVGTPRKLGMTDAVVIGVGSMVGAGVFSVWAPAASAAGSGLLIGLAIAAVVAYCNAMSSARLAARYPAFGGTYVYGRERLGPFWGYLAGWCFVVGKTASCAVMALTVGNYVWQAHAHLVAVIATIAVTALSYGGVQRSALVTRVIVVVVLAVLVLVVLVGSTGRATGGAAYPALTGDVLQAAGLLFFAFAGYARLATLGEDVADPARTIPRAIPVALGITLVTYTAVALTVLAVVGDQLPNATAALADVVRTVGVPWLAPVVQTAAALASLGALIALLLGVSRTALAMARDGYLPRVVNSVHQPSGVPRHAELAVGVVVAVLAGFVDLVGAIGFSSFGVLLYYAIANAAAWTLGARLLPAVGFVGCLVLAFSLPVASVVAGAAFVVAGALVYTQIGPSPRSPRKGADPG